MFKNNLIKKILLLSLEITSCSYNPISKVRDIDLITLNKYKILLKPEQATPKVSIKEEKIIRETICTKSLKYFSKLFYPILPNQLGNYINEKIYEHYSVELKEDINRLDSNDILIKCRSIGKIENMPYKETISLEKEISELLQELTNIVIDNQRYHSKSIKYLKKRIADYTKRIKKIEDEVKKLVKKKYIEEICKGNYSEKSKLNKYDSSTYIENYTFAPASKEFIQQIKSTSKLEFLINESTTYMPLYKKPISIDFTEDSILNRLDILGIYNFTTYEKFNTFLLSQGNLIQLSPITKTIKNKKVKKLFDGLFNCTGSGNTVDLGRKGLVDLAKWKHKTNCYTDLKWNCEGKRVSLTFVADKETIQNVSTRFYNQGNSPTCAYNSIGRGLFILGQLVTLYNYRSFLIKLGEYVNTHLGGKYVTINSRRKLVLFEIIKKLYDIDIEQVTKQSLINSGLYYFIIKQIFDYSSKK